MKSGIDRFDGIWESEDGYRLDITKTSDTSAVVSFYNPMGESVKRPYFDDRPTIKMIASYDNYFGEFRIDLWEEGKGFELDIVYEMEYELDKWKRESLVPGITRNEKDKFLDKYYRLFGNLKHFNRVKR